MRPPPAQYPRDLRLLPGGPHRYDREAPPGRGAAPQSGGGHLFRDVVMNVRRGAQGRDRAGVLRHVPGLMLELEWTYF